MSRKQCAKCPWKVDVDPFDIPDGYSPEKHAALAETIAEPASINIGTMRIFACHESKPGSEIPCAGWIANQLGPGNNIGLRLAAMRGAIDPDVELDGDQHKCFEDTLP